MKGIETTCLLLSFEDMQNIVRTKAKSQKINVIKVESYDFKALILRIYLSNNDINTAKEVLDSLNIREDFYKYYKDGLISLSIEKAYESIFNRKLHTTFNNGETICFVFER